MIRLFEKKLLDWKKSGMKKPLMVIRSKANWKNIYDWQVWKRKFWAISIFQSRKKWRSKKYIWNNYWRGKDNRRTWIIYWKENRFR